MSEPSFTSTVVRMTGRAKADVMGALAILGAIGVASAVALPSEGGFATKALVGSAVFGAVFGVAWWRFRERIRCTLKLQDEYLDIIPNRGRRRRIARPFVTMYGRTWEHVSAGTQERTARLVWVHVKGVDGEFLFRRLMGVLDTVPDWPEAQLPDVDIERTYSSLFFDPVGLLAAL